jgi:hypothetical protein
MKLDKFDVEEFKSMVNLGMYGSKFPEGLTLEFIFDTLNWLTTDDGRDYLADAYDWWKNKEEEPSPEQSGAKVNLTFVQTVQWNEECGFWFDQVTLRVVHSYGEKTVPGGEVFMKKTHNKTGSFRADLSDIPMDAEILEAYLVMKLNKHEGIANADRAGVFEIRNGKDVAIAEITADWINKNYQKYSKPNVKIDLTQYIKGLFRQG